MFYGKRPIKQTLKRDTQKRLVKDTTEETCLLADIHHSHHDMFCENGQYKKPSKENYKRDLYRDPNKILTKRDVLTC